MQKKRIIETVTLPGDMTMSRAMVLVGKAILKADPGELVVVVVYGWKDEDGKVSGK